MTLTGRRLWIDGIPYWCLGHLIAGPRYYDRVVVMLDTPWAQMLAWGVRKWHPLMFEVFRRESRRLGLKGGEPLPRFSLSALTYLPMWLISRWGKKVDQCP